MASKKFIASPENIAKGKKMLQWAEGKGEKARLWTICELAAQLGLDENLKPLQPLNKLSAKQINKRDKLNYYSTPNTTYWNKQKNRLRGD